MGIHDGIVLCGANQLSRQVPDFVFDSDDIDGFVVFGGLVGAGVDAVECKMMLGEFVEGVIAGH